MKSSLSFLLLEALPRFVILMIGGSSFFSFTLIYLFRFWDLMEVFYFNANSRSFSISFSYTIMMECLPDVCPRPGSL